MLASQSWTFSCPSSQPYCSILREVVVSDGFPRTIVSKTCQPKLGKDLVLRKLGIQMLSICALLGKKKKRFGRRKWWNSSLAQFELICSLRGLWLVYLHAEYLTPCCTELAKKCVQDFPWDPMEEPQQIFWPTQCQCFGFKQASVWTSVFLIADYVNLFMLLILPEPLFSCPWKRDRNTSLVVLHWGLIGTMFEWHLYSACPE